MIKGTTDYAWPFAACASHSSMPVDGAAKWQILVGTKGIGMAVPIKTLSFLCATTSLSFEAANVHTRWL